VRAARAAVLWQRRPRCAASWPNTWETDDEGWRFKLREAYFHNGNRVTAAA